MDSSKPGGKGGPGKGGPKTGPGNPAPPKAQGKPKAADQHGPASDAATKGNPGKGNPSNPPGKANPGKGTSGKGNSANTTGKVTTSGKAAAALPTSGQGDGQNHKAKSDDGGAGKGALPSGGTSKLGSQPNTTKPSPVGVSTRSRQASAAKNDGPKQEQTKRTAGVERQGASTAPVPKASSKDSHSTKEDNNKASESSSTSVVKEGEGGLKGTSTLVSFSLRKSTNKVTTAVAAFTPEATDADEGEADKAPRSLNLPMPSPHTPPDDSEEMAEKKEEEGNSTSQGVGGSADPNSSLMTSFVKVASFKEPTSFLDWPTEMVQHTKTQPPIPYSCNPLHFDFKLLLKASTQTPHSTVDQPPAEATQGQDTAAAEADKSLTQSQDKGEKEKKAGKKKKKKKKKHKHSQKAEGTQDGPAEGTDRQRKWGLKRRKGASIKRGNRSGRRRKTAIKVAVKARKTKPWPTANLRKTPVTTARDPNANARTRRLWMEGRDQHMGRATPLWTWWMEMRPTRSNRASDLLTNAGKSIRVAATLHAKAGPLPMLNLRKDPKPSPK